MAMHHTGSLKNPKSYHFNSFIFKKIIPLNGSALYLPWTEEQGEARRQITSQGLEKIPIQFKELSIWGGRETNTQRVNN